MSSAPGPPGPLGPRGPIPPIRNTVQLSRAQSAIVMEKLGLSGREGQIRLQSVQTSQHGGARQILRIPITSMSRIVSASPTLSTMSTTPMKVLHSVHTVSSAQPSLTSLPSPLTTTRTIKIGSPKPPITVAGSRPTSSTPQKPSGLVLTSAALPSPHSSTEMVTRPGKRPDIEFESFSDSKRRKTDKGGKGLRHFSMKVCEKVKAKGTTSYNEVADELVAELTDPRCQSPSDQQYDQKNIRRRVYDALNVLMAMNIISKEKKEIRWLGLPTNSVQEATSLEAEKAKRIDRIKAKTEQLQDLILQQIAFKKLVERNKEAEKKSRRPTPNSVIEIPFIIVSTNNKTIIECAISNDKKEYLFDFDNTFEIHDDMFVLKKMNMAMGLERPGGGQVSEEDLKRARAMVPRALEQYVVQLAQHGPGSYSMPKVTAPPLHLVKEDPDSPGLFGHSAISLDQDDEDEEIE
jgi:hypothetical protein